MFLAAVCSILLVALAAIPLPAIAGSIPAVVAPEWLAAHGNDPRMIIIDARPSVRAYIEMHIPGAVPLAPDNLRSVDGGVPARIYPLEVLDLIAGRLGACTDSPMVVYGEESDVDATFVATILKICGLDNVAVLEGGWKRWIAEGRPTTAERRIVPASNLEIRVKEATIAAVDRVREAAASASAVILDVRPAEQYGSGHIPGAVHRFWKADLIGEGLPGAGSYRPIDDLRAEYASIGITGDRSAIVYCGTGHMASSSFYILRYHLGLTNVLLYEGGWAEWSMLPDMPTETRVKVDLPVPAPIVARARKAADDLTQTLRTRLMEEMKAGGPIQAVRVCAEVAQKISDAQSTEGLSIRRITLKVRNPADTPDAYEATKLREMQDLHRDGKLPLEHWAIQENAGKRSYRYFRPILVGDMCLSCHGSRAAIDPQVRAILDATYPDDEAVGYKTGDFRGAISVEVVDR